MTRGNILNSSPREQKNSTKPIKKMSKKITEKIKKLLTLSNKVC